MAARITLDQLQTLIAVAECGSFSAAARRVNRVQSAVSQAIQSLEDALQVQLFDRSQKLPRLTDAGTAILGDARRILSRTDSLRARARSISEETEPEVRLAIEQVFPNEILIASLKDFHTRYPSVSVTLIGDGLGAPEQSLEEGIASTAIYSPVSDGMAGIQLRFFGNVPITVVAASSHPLARCAGPITQESLDEHVQLILSDRSKRVRGVIMGARTWSFVDQFSRLDFVLNGFGWSLMPRHLARPHIDRGDLVELDLAIYSGRHLWFPLYAAHRADHPPGPAAQWLVQDMAQRFESWSGAQIDELGEPLGIQVRVTAA
ncbi:LysR family transcriptional regulator [Salipiger sp.]|uniref:LysR family transcriptional regulator n=1 Tax=Salipiger sp. TaxID=2078585 RepID=UPI003A9843A4